MRVAALYDIHGMPWALEAVLSEVDADAIAHTLRSGWPLARSFVDENLAQAPSRSEAIAQFRPAGT